MQVRRSWWKRVVPVRIRHNLRLILGSIVCLVLVGGLLGSFPLQPIVFSTGSSTLTSSIVNNIEGNIDLFDLNQPHTLNFEMSDLEYERMIAEFQGDGEKAWIQVDAEIDGLLIRSVGIRLKGNSTIMSLGGGGDILSFDSMFGDFEMPPMPEGFEMPPMPEGFDMQAGMEDMMSNMSNVSFDDPATLPLLISFDEFVPGRGYQGRTELALRSVAEGSTNLNEGIALQLIADSGQISQKYTWVSYSVNGSNTITRLILENPNQNYAADLGRGPGVLYKSRAGNTFAYHGDDQTLYAEDFLQLNAIGSHDLTPVIRFLAWLEAASDEEFDAELPTWIDIPSFAQYVVTHELMNNFDDMAGPGRNFLFWYSLVDEKFTVATWDMNLAISGMAGMFGGAPGGGFPGFPGGGGFPGFPGGGGFPGFPAPPNNDETPPAGFPAPPAGFPPVPGVATNNTGEEPPVGFPAPPTGFPTPPEGFPPAPEVAATNSAGDEPPAGFPAPPAGFPPIPGGGFPFPPGGGFPGFGEGFPEGMEMPPGLNFGNDLKERFMASEEFADDIAQARAELLELWFTSGRAVELLNELSKFVPISDRLNAEQIEAEIISLTETISAVQ